MSTEETECTAVKLLMPAQTNELILRDLAVAENLTDTAA
jgi:hypothetical protein